MTGCKEKCVLNILSFFGFFFFSFLTSISAKLPVRFILDLRFKYLHSFKFSVVYRKKEKPTDSIKVYLIISGRKFVLRTWQDNYSWAPNIHHLLCHLSHLRNRKISDVAHQAHNPSKLKSCSLWNNKFELGLEPSLGED